MASIVSLVAEKTYGKSYKSFRYCVDEQTRLPKLDYDEAAPTYTVQGDRYGENSNRKIRNLGQLARRCKQDNSPLFRYFLDGSRRVYKVDDMEYGRRIYPLMGGQIGVACCERVNRGSFRVAQLENHLVLALPTAANADGGDTTLFFNRLTTKINELPRIQRTSLRFSRLLAYSSSKSQGTEYKPEDLGTAEIQNEMLSCEKKVVANLTARRLLTPDSYLLKDGSLQYKADPKDPKELAKIKNNYRWVVGVSKSFDPELVKDRNNKSQAAVIAQLSCYERTPAYMYHAGVLGDIKFSIWYVRIRDRRYTDSPFAGILKVEKILITPEEMETGLDSEEVDLITANLINESYPVCYGQDQRWANHLYPVFLTESLIKSKYLSDLYFLNLF